jgi:dTDP-4-amino-4,6-dideoxygalactose transaminase
MTVSFNRITLTGKEAHYLGEVLGSRNWSGGGSFSSACEAWLEQHIGSPKAMLTSSCTSALEIAAMLIDTQAGDEIIMPSYTFVSTANAFVLRGGMPVFVDICEDTLNIDSTLIEAAITPKTKAIVVMHYGGVGCEMDAIMAIARKHKLRVIEDNAHGILASYKDKPLGSFGDLSTLSFHELKMFPVVRAVH